MKFNFWPFKKKKTVVKKTFVPVPERHPPVFTVIHREPAVRVVPTTVVVDDPAEDVMEAVLINNLVQAEVAAIEAGSTYVPDTDPSPSYNPSYDAPSNYDPGPSYDPSPSYDPGCSYDDNSCGGYDN